MSRVDSGDGETRGDEVREDREGQEFQAWKKPVKEGRRSPKEEEQEPPLPGGRWRLLGAPNGSHPEGLGCG